MKNTAKENAEMHPFHLGSNTHNICHKLGFYRSLLADTPANKIILVTDYIAIDVSFCTMAKTQRLGYP